MFQRLYLVILFILAAIIIFPITALAAPDQTQQAFAMIPVPDANLAITAKGYFVYQLQSGANANGKLQLQNTSDQPITVALDAVEAQTAQTGGSSFSLPGEKLSGAATWLKLETNSVALAVGETRQIGFSLQIPTGTAPQQYLTGISAYVVAAAAPSAAAGDAQHLGAAITMQTRQVIGVEADVPGDWQSSLTITNVSLMDQPSGAYLGMTLRNDGATFIKPSGTMVISDASGALLATQPITMSTFVPGTQIIYPVALANRPANGDYQISVDLNYDTTKIAHYDNLLTVADVAPANVAAPASGPLNIPAGQQAPAVSGNTVPASVAPTSAATDNTTLLVLAGGGLLLLLALVIIFGALRRRRTA